MANTTYNASSRDVLVHRKKGGLCSTKKDLQLTQHELSVRLQLKYYTFMTHTLAARRREKSLAILSPQRG